MERTAGAVVQSLAVKYTEHRAFMILSAILRLIAIIGIWGFLMESALLPTIWTHPTKLNYQFDTGMELRWAKNTWLAELRCAGFALLFYGTITGSAVYLISVRRLWARTRAINAVAALCLAYILAYTSLVGMRWKPVDGLSDYAREANIDFLPSDRPSIRFYWQPLRILDQEVCSSKRYRCLNGGKRFNLIGLPNRVLIHASCSQTVCARAATAPASPVGNLRTLDQSRARNFIPMAVSGKFLRIKRSLLLAPVQLLCSVFVLPSFSARALSPGSFRDEIRPIREWRENGRPVAMSRKEQLLVRSAWPSICQLVEDIRTAGENPPLSPEERAMIRERIALNSGLLPAEQEKELDAIAVTQNGYMQARWLDELSGALEELVAFENPRVMRLIGPLLAENAPAAQGCDSPKPTVQLRALDAAKMLSSQGILPKKTKQLQTVEQWQAWWEKHKTEYGAVLKLPERKSATKTQ